MDLDSTIPSSNDKYGHQGSGCQYISPNARLKPVVVGGSQERGLRPGTEDLYAIAGFGEDAHLTGHPSNRLPYHASFRFGRVERKSILLTMDAMFNIQVSNGSAGRSNTVDQVLVVANAVRQSKDSERYIRFN